MNDKELELKVTIKVKNGSADGAASALHRSVRQPGGGVRIGTACDGGGYLRGPLIEVTAIERVDGQPLGLLAEFEGYWAESHCEGDDEVAGEMWSYAKVQAWGAFQAAYEIYGGL